MSQNDQTLPLVYLARHGETAWTVSGQHTGVTDLPLTERGERNARRLGDRPPLSSRGLCEPRSSRTHNSSGEHTAREKRVQDALCERTPVHWGESALRR